MLKDYSQIGKRNNCTINDQVIYTFFISNKFIDFLESI